MKRLLVSATAIATRAAKKAAQSAVIRRTSDAFVRIPPKDATVISTASLSKATRKDRNILARTMGSPLVCRFSFSFLEVGQLNCPNFCCESYLRREDTTE